MLLIALVGALASALPTSPTPIADSLPLQQAIGDRTGWQAARAFRSAPRDKVGRVTLSCPVDDAYLDAKAFQGTKGYLVLAAPKPSVEVKDALKKPELRDRLEVRIAPAVVARLKKQGIQDVAAHFQNHMIQVTGKTVETIYLCRPAFAVYTILVERSEDIKILADEIVPKEPEKL